MEKILVESFEEAKQSNHFVEVYDNSTDTTVDKLLVVNPYGWILWNYSGRLFLVNPETTTCPNGFSVFEIPKSVNLTFTRKCVNGKLVDLLNFYHTKRVAQTIPFEPKKNYTILDCIEFLSHGIVYLDTSGSNNQALSIEFNPQKVYDSFY